LAPFAPHIGEELLRGTGREGSVHTQAWPAYDASKLEADEVTIAVEVNGKVRATVGDSIRLSAGEVEILDLALTDVEKWLDGKEPKKMIVVPGRVVSIVI